MEQVLIQCRVIAEYLNYDAEDGWRINNAPKRFWGVFSLTCVIALTPSTNTLTDDVMRQNLAFTFLSQRVLSGNVNWTG